MGDPICWIYQYYNMEKKIRQGKTTKLIRETEKDTIGLVVPPMADRYTNNPIEEEEIIIEETEAATAQLPLDKKIPSEQKPLPADPIDPPSPPLDNPDISKTDTDERKERDRKNRKNFLLLALGGLALLFVANN